MSTALDTLKYSAGREPYIDPAEFDRRCELKPVSKALPEIHIYGLMASERRAASIGRQDVPAESLLGTMGTSAFHGGQAMARSILDHPEWVKGKNVLDLGSGSGLVAIAAALSGARQVIALDKDRAALEVIQHNAVANGVTVITCRGTHRDLQALGQDYDLLTACDVFYSDKASRDETGASEVEHALFNAANSGKTVYAASNWEETPLLSAFGAHLSPPDLSNRQTGKRDPSKSMQTFVMISNDTIRRKLQETPAPGPKRQGPAGGGFSSDP